ncbi:hypothetical protein Ctob_005403 [Chrysochromulina tobinii]|uniref:Uncharacterized protein n=1 Tax=Chrysochromulina tobinii TaxID=1460289 RepID=A0A0M0J6J0_9EUKA|nr:hypothetical protein Ctob_005403 [Chrysochromulina tobinii]|eukprot:KOO22229.1 hypothetical protein Ctob_005403 [Chrysochromulina sp. CCMP291]
MTLPPPVLAERRAALKREEGARRRGEARLAQELAFRDRLLANLANLAVGKQEEELSRAVAIQGHQVQSSAIKELSRAVAIQGHPAGAPFGARHDASEGKAWRALMEGIAVKARRYHAELLAALADAENERVVRWCASKTRR